MLKQLLGIGLLTAVLIIPAVTWSQPGPPPGPRGGKFMDGPGQGPPRPGMDFGRWWEHPEVQKKLALNPEQVEKLGAQQLETETKMIEVESKRKIAHLHLRNLVSKKDSSEEEISKRIDEIGELQKEQMRAAIGQIRGVRSILNEDQQKKVEEFLKVRRERAHRGPLFKGGPKTWDGKPWTKDGKGERGDRGEKGPGKDIRRGKDRGEGDGPRPPHRGFGMAPEGPDHRPGYDGPEGLDAPPPKPEFGGPAGPPDDSVIPEDSLGAGPQGAPVPPGPNPELGWVDEDFDSSFMVDDFAAFEEPVEDILADFE